jgi:hypothetical protein
MSMLLLLRLAGASLIVLSLFHVVLWRALDWGPDIERLSPLTARVFLVHTIFIALVLCALGLLSLVRPELLLAPGELARLLLAGIVVFWLVRLAIQPLVFDRVMRVGWTQSLFVRIGATLVWIGYVAVYGLALLQQYRGEGHP